MATDSLSSTAQSIGSPGPLVLTYLDVTGAGTNITLTLSPTYARIVNPIFSPHMVVNRSVEGGFHIFEYSTNEALTWNIEIQNLPSLNMITDQREQSMGYLDLLSFVRYTLNYSEKNCQILAPDGFLEPSMKYLGGLETLAEADAGQRNTAQVAHRWAGILTFSRTLPFVEP